MKTLKNKMYGEFLTNDLVVSMKIYTKAIIDEI